MAIPIRPVVERTRAGGTLSRWVLPKDATRCPGRTGVCGKLLDPEDEDGITQYVCVAGHRWWPAGYEPREQAAAGAEPSHRRQTL